jgi:glycosyltransferase involved in cell wall biosynthesis
MSLQVSIITAVKNRASTLGACLRSVQAQSWPGVEHIVVDGGSTDGTLGVLAASRAHLARLICEPDGGVYEALNKGIAAASGDIIGFLHADDEFASAETLEHVARAFEDPAVEAVYGDLMYVRQDDPRHVVRYWRAGQCTRERLANGWMPPHPTFYVRRDVYRRFGAFDTRFKIAADYENMLRILWRGGVKAAYLPEVMVRMRTGGLSNRLLNVFMKSREDYAAMRENGIGALQALLLKNVTKLPQFVVKTSVAH